MEIFKESVRKTVPMRRKAIGVKSVLALAVMAILCWMLFETAADQYRWQWYRVWRFWGFWEDGDFHAGVLLEALETTLSLAAIGLLLSAAVGAVFASMKLSASPVARCLSSAVLGSLRNTPLLMQLFMMYFVAAPVFGMGPYASAVWSLGLFEGAFLAEIFRAGILAVPRTQWEAAFTLGMPCLMTVRLVIIPQALRSILPALTGQAVSLIKDTSLVSAIAVADLTMRARMVITDTFLSFEIWLLVAAAYLMLTLFVSIPAKIMEHKEHL